MPLIDAYIKCDTIEGSYKASNKKIAAKREIAHQGWSEITSFRYTLDSGEYPDFTITKPIDNASNDLYILLLKNRAREVQKGKAAVGPIIKKVSIELCRWVDTNQDGVIDEFQVFLEYTFKNCRVISYATDIDFAADELPEEEITFGFREMTMTYYHPDESAGFSWNFAKLAPIAK